MNRTNMAVLTAWVFGVVGCDGRQPAEPGDIAQIGAPISPKVADLNLEDIEKLALEEREKIAAIEEQLRFERQKQEDCATALGRLDVFRAERGALQAQLEELPTRHAALVVVLAEYDAQQRIWSDGFSEAVQDRQPDWGAIGDMGAYAAAEQQIEQLGADGAADAALSQRYRAVIERLSAVSGDVAAILGRIDTVAELGNRCVSLTGILAVPPQGGDGLREQLARLHEAYRDMLGAFQRVGDKRRNMAPVVQAAWRRLLRVAQYNVYMAQANSLVSDTFRARNDAPTYFEVNRQIDAGYARMRDLFYRSYSPYLAVRAARVLGVLLDDIERNLPELPITDVNRNDIRNKVVGSRSSLASFQGRLEGLTERDYAFFANRRRLLAERALAEAADAPSERCKELMEQCGQTTMEGELSYSELQRECTAGVGDEDANP